MSAKPTSSPSLTLAESLYETSSELSEDEKDEAFARSVVGVWDVDGERISVSETPRGLVAVDSRGKEVGAGMVFGGRKVSEAPGVSVPQRAKARAQSSAPTQFEGPRVIDGPKKIVGGEVIRVISQYGIAIPQRWKDGSWETVASSYLADAAMGSELTAEGLEQLGIPIDPPRKQRPAEMITCQSCGKLALETEWFCPHCDDYLERPVVPGIGLLDGPMRVADGRVLRVLSVDGLAQPKHGSTPVGLTSIAVNWWKRQEVTDYLPRNSKVLE